MKLEFILRNGIVTAGYLDAEEEKFADKLMKGIKTTKTINKKRIISQILRGIFE